MKIRTVIMIIVTRVTFLWVSTMLRALHIFSRSYGGVTIFVPILQMGELRLRNVKRFA